MMHTGKLDRLNTINEIEIKTIELGSVICIFMLYFFSCLSIFHTFIYLFILIVLCFVFVYFCQCGIKTKGTLSSDV